MNQHYDINLLQYLARHDSACLLHQDKIWHCWRICENSNGVKNCIFHGQPGQVHCFILTDANHSQHSTDGEYLPYYFQSKLESFTTLLIYFCLMLLNYLQLKTATFTKLHQYKYIGFKIYYYLKLETSNMVQQNDVEDSVVEDNQFLLDTIAHDGLASNGFEYTKLSTYQHLIQSRIQDISITNIRYLTWTFRPNLLT
jgi:hypothetical protein